MAFLILKVLLIFIYIHSSYLQETSDSSDELCDYNSDNNQCATVSQNIGDENSTDFVTVTTVDDNSTAITVGDNNSTEFPDTTDGEISTTVTISTTTPVQTTQEPSYEMHFIPEDVCSCDLTVNFCDINCCCDEDCSGTDRQAFSHCFKRPPISPDPRYCYQTNFVYHNNTEFKMTQTKENLFCILWDNMPSETRYVKKKAVTNLQDFYKYYNKHKFYHWPPDVSSSFVFHSTAYRAGSIVWSIANNTISPLVFPRTFTSAFCDVSTPVRYLVDWSGSCTRPNLECGPNSTLSATTYYKLFYVVAAPHLMNSSQVAYFLEQQECLFNVCLPFNVFLCSLESNEVDSCLPIDDIEAPIHDNKLNICLNVVKKIKYLFFHNGTQGIMRAEVYIWVIALSSNQFPLRQTFSVNFLWADSPHKPFQRSGKPGYIIGKPVITGEKIIRLSDSDKEPDKEAILLSNEPSKWLTLPRAGSDGLCMSDVIEGSRVSITVGDDMKSSCFVKLAIKDLSSEENCSIIQRKILKLMLGEAMNNVTEAKHFNLYVSTFGDAVVENTGDWVPVLLENFPYLFVTWKQEDNALICRNIVKRMHINIITAKVGLVTRPQLKILGVAITFGEGEDFVFDCYPWHCSHFDARKTQKFAVSASVSFLDVSKPPVIYFAEPPVYEVKLPYDFFYPFLSSNCPKPVTYWCTAISTLVWAIRYITFYC